MSVNMLLLNVFVELLQNIFEKSYMNITKSNLEFQFYNLARKKK